MEVGVDQGNALDHGVGPCRRAKRWILPVTVLGSSSG
jgi:hypothetical protein